MTESKSRRTRRRTGQGKPGAKPALRNTHTARKADSPRLIIGIGASAGGLEAFRTFFANMPADSGMAFVLVQHLDPHHKSMLVDLLGRHTKMKVVEAADGMRVAANRIFIIPPNATLTMADGALRVTKPAPVREYRRPIDTFFASLAQDQAERAVCIVLSGTGSDGTLGLRKVKEHGGLSLAQADDDATAMSGMPQSAAATGLVDHIIPAAQMPALLMDYQQHLSQVAPRKDGDGNRRDTPAHLAAIFALLRARTGHDFSQYKHSTLLRRIQRRMQVLRIDTVPAYIEHLRKEPRQVELLFHEFLIGVTQFFRDPEAFEALQSTVIPGLLKHKSAEDPIRIWVPGCATGEEVYSIAILVREAMERQGAALKVQIFGTDIDEAAVAIARTARYSKMEGVTQERIERWFTEDGDEYRPVREIREMCIFSTHSVVRDPPFSKLDLISCRNLLIYLENSLQDRLMQTFHYALRPGGYLYLGQSESITRKANLFATLDKKHRIFQRREASGAAPDFPMGAPAGKTGRTRAEPARMPSAPSAQDAIDTQVRRVMDKYSPAYVVIDRQHDILRFSGGDVGRYLEPSPGTASLNLFSIVRKALRPAVRAALQRAEKTAEPIATENTMLKIDGRSRSVRLIVEPLGDRPGPDEGRWIVAFQQTATAATGKDAKRLASVPQADVQALEQELQTTKTQLRATIDELETSNEGMKSAIEEYQSVNEELQSSNEELETAKEEMQSVNEELQTINAEMIGKNEMLTRLNSDLKNLLESTQIATIFLDDKLHIKSFTPAMTDLFHLRDSDRGRPLTEIVTRMHYADLRRDVSKVLRTLAVIEHEVRITQDEKVFIMRIRPYRSVDNVIDGVVITFIDITERKRHEEAISRLAAIVDSSQDAIIGHAFDGTITSWNSGAEAIFGYTAAEAIGKPFSTLIPENQRDEVPQLLEKLKRGERVDHFEIDRIRKDGQTIDVSLAVSPIKDAAGKMIAASTIARQFTERKAAEDHKNLLMAELDHRVKNTLMVITSLIAQTAKTTNSPQKFAEIIQGRIQALSRVHNLLNQNDWDQAALYDVVAGELAPYRDGNRENVVIEGQADIALTPKATQTLAMALHELATNAGKYGALSTPAGKVAVSWRVANSRKDPRLSIEWIETGGPPVTTPTRRGFGSQLIERIVTYDLKAEVRRDFHAEGVRCKIEFPLTDQTGHVVARKRARNSRLVDA